MQNTFGIVMSIVIVVVVVFVLVGPTKTISTVLGWARAGINKLFGKK